MPGPSHRPTEQGAAVSEAEQDRIIEMLVREMGRAVTIVEGLAKRLRELEMAEENRKAATELRTNVSTWGRA